MNDIVKKMDTPVAVSPASADISPLVQMAMQGNVNTEQLRELLAIQKEWQADEARKSYAKAMAEFRSRTPKIVKDSVVDFSSQKGRTHYKHASLGMALEAINPLLGELGLNPSFQIDDTESGLIRVTCKLTHRDGHSESVEMSGPFDNSGNKNLLQQRASTIKYLQRYTLFAICGLAASDDDDDGQGGAKAQPAATQPPPRKKYTDDQFVKQMAGWKAKVESGELSAGRIITQVCNHIELTESQNEQIQSLRDYTPVPQDTANAE